jgi:hypothetical protein
MSGTRRDRLIRTLCRDDINAARTCTRLSAEPRRLLAVYFSASPCCVVAKHLDAKRL